MKLFVVSSGGIKKYWLAKSELLHSAECYLLICQSEFLVFCVAKRLKWYFLFKTYYNLCFIYIFGRLSFFTVYRCCCCARKQGCHASIFVRGHTDRQRCMCTQTHTYTQYTEMERSILSNIFLWAFKMHPLLFQGY